VDGVMLARESIGYRRVGTRDERRRPCTRSSQLPFHPGNLVGLWAAISDGVQHGRPATVEQCAGHVGADLTADQARQLLEELAAQDTP
jgi:hypothetical protein